jgi:hypothetical protein
MGLLFYTGAAISAVGAMLIDERRRARRSSQS